MSIRKMVSFVFAGFVIALMLTNFQNCAPAPMHSASGATNDPQVRLVDQWNTQKVAFAEPSVVTQSQVNEVNFYGLCAQSEEGTTLHWWIKGDQQVISSGQTECAHNNFVVSASPLTSLKCGQQYTIEAQTEGGAKGQMTVTRECPPLAAQVMSDNGQSQCKMELSQLPNGLSQCVYSCYEEGRLSHSQTLSLNQCAGLRI